MDSDGPFDIPEGRVDVGDDTIRLGNGVLKVRGSEAEDSVRLRPGVAGRAGGDIPRLVSLFHRLGTLAIGAAANVMEFDRTAFGVVGETPA